MSDERFAANLQNVGLVLKETEVLLAAHRELHDWSAVRRRALDENLLGKGSTTTVRHILKVVRRRYLEPPEWLPDEPAYFFFAAPGVPERAKAQVALLYTLAEDPLARTCHMSLVVSPPVGDPALHPSDVVRFLDALVTDHPELKSWRPYLTKRWSQGFIALLRETGFIEAAPRWRVLDPVILPEAFALVFGWLVQTRGSARGAIESPALRLWDLDDAETAALLREGQHRGWWRYASGGAMVEFQPLYGSVEELVGALG